MRPTRRDRETRDREPVARTAANAPGEARPRPGVWKLAAQLAAAALVTWIIVDRVGVTLDEALSPGAAVVEWRALPLAGSCLLLLLCFAAAARLWGRMVGELGGPDPGWGASVRIVLTANLGRYLPGKVWQVASLALLSRRAGVPASIGTAAGALGQIFHLAGAAIVGGAVLAGPTGQGRGQWIALGAFAVLVLAASIPALLHPGLRLAFRLARLDPTSAPRPDPFFGPRWIVLHTIVWCGYGAAFVLLLRGMGIDAAPVGPAAAFGAAYLLGYLAVFVPAGLGVREGVLIALVRPSLGSAAVGVAIAARVWMTVLELVPAGAVAAWEISRGDEPPDLRRNDAESEGKGDDG